MTHSQSNLLLVVLCLPACVAFTVLRLSNDTLQSSAEAQREKWPFPWPLHPGRAAARRRQQEETNWSPPSKPEPRAGDVIEHPLEVSSEETSESEGEEESIEAPIPYKKNLLLIGVNTMIRNNITRAYHRNSWMAHRYVREGVVQVRFLLGENGSDFPTDHLENDFLHLHVPEDYHELTAKVTAYLDWARENSDTDYIMKLDDDSYPHLDSLLPFLRDNTDELAYFGGRLSHGYVRDWGKYAETEYSHERYPPYMQGAGYILSRKLVDEIERPPYKLESYSNENATIGIRINKLSENGRHIAFKEVKGTLYGCHKKDVLSMNWDPREFPCVARVEARAARKQYPNPIEGMCCGHEHRHWSESEGQTGR